MNINFSILSPVTGFVTTYGCRVSRLLSRTDSQKAVFQQNSLNEGKSQE